MSRFILFCYLYAVTPFFSMVFAQSTSPAAFDMSGGASYLLNSYSGTNPPANIVIGREDNAAPGNFLTPLELDAPNGASVGEWKAESANGLSYQGSQNAARGAFLLALNTTGRTNITVAWKVRVIEPHPAVNCIELQYRVGNTGNFSNVSGDLFQQGTTADGTAFSILLPVTVENQALVQVRWIYYGITTGNRDRLAIDDIAVTSIVLPVQLKSFHVFSKDKSVDLVWETETEKNNKEFVIERSADGRVFSEIGTVAGAGDSYTLQSYKTTDVAPLSAVSYYRLRQMDWDGQFSYSPVRTVHRSSTGQIQVWPTQVVSQVQVRLSEASETDLNWTVYDLSGKQLLSGIVAADNKQIEITVENLPNGSFILQVGDSKERFFHLSN